MKITYPDEHFFKIHPCHVALCFECHPAANLLAVFAYLCNPQDEKQADVRISEKSQADLVEAMVHEETEKTIHDVACPFLQLLGFVDIEMTPRGIEYIFHLDYFLQALACYVPKQKKQTELEKFLIAHLQLEKFLIDWTAEKVANAIRKISKEDKRNFLTLLEKVLIVNRNFSNSPRGRKPKTEAALDTVSEDPKNLEEPSKNEERTYAGSSEPAVAPASHSQDVVPPETADDTQPSTTQPLRIAISDIVDADILGADVLEPPGYRTPIDFEERKRSTDEHQAVNTHGVAMGDEPRTPSGQLIRMRGRAFEQRSRYRAGTSWRCHTSTERRRSC